ncbi:MAG: M48 family metallopeptidase [Alphaproteobacteria bacterium]
MTRASSHRAGAVPGLSLVETQSRAEGLQIGAPVAIRISPRARRLLLRLDAATRRFDLVLPHGLPPETALQFLEAQRGWIAARLGALPARVKFEDGAVVPVLGMPHRIRHEGDPAAPPVAITDREIRVRGGPEHIARRVRDHLVRLAARQLTVRARLHAARLGATVTRVTVRDTKSRWGSCSSSGALSFSWRLILTPERVLDYVVAHEVAHLIEMNHSPRFWKLVRALVADPAAQRAWLKQHRAELLSYG